MLPWVEQAGTHLNPGCLLFGILLFLVIFLYTFQKAISSFRVLNILNMHTHTDSVGKNLFLNLFAYNIANSMLGDIRDFQVCHGNM